ncbi:MAG: class SAM-dependent methyltransferase [Chloroflexota bacterium]|nr:class SAM-dependent methyltransferase [Chloroflexota bacterium]
MNTPANPPRPAAPVVPIADVIANVDAQILDLIRRSLRIRTESHSSFKDKVTGNAYQSVRIRDEVLPGFRLSNEDIYVGMGIAEQTLIDLGCNLGERTRIAVRAGARFAEGVEYEDLFVRIGCLINTYNRMQGIEIRQGDITQPGCLARDYDIGACFSAFVYVKENLQEILSRIRRLFILETHALGRHWYATNVTAVRKFMPYWVIYDMTDHGARLEDGKRACIAFGRDADTVRGIAGTRARELGTRNGNVVGLDLENSPRIVHLFGGPERKTQPIYATLRAALGSMANPDPQTLVPYLLEAATALKAAAIPDAQEGFGTDSYWQELFAGIAQRVHDGKVTVANSYLRHLRHLSDIGKYDAHMQAVLANEASAVERVTWRLDAILDILLTRAAPEQLPIVFNPMSPKAAEAAGLSTSHLADPYFVTDLAGERYLAPIIDGYHRLAALYLAGVPSAPCMVIWTNLHPLDLRIGTTPLERGVRPELASWDDPAVGRTIEGTVERLFRADAAPPQGDATPKG